MNGGKPDNESRAGNRRIDFVNGYPTGLSSSFDNNNSDCEYLHPYEDEFSQHIRILNVLFSEMDVKSAIKGLYFFPLKKPLKIILFQVFCQFLAAYTLIL